MTPFGSNAEPSPLNPTFTISIHIAETLRLKIAADIASMFGEVASVQGVQLPSSGPSLLNLKNNFPTNKKVLVLGEHSHSGRPRDVIPT
jgi:hypothetical protein